MRPKDKMLIDCAAIDQAYAYLTKPEHLTSVRVAGDVVELLTALEASGMEREQLQMELNALVAKDGLRAFWWQKSIDEARLTEKLEEQTHHDWHKAIAERNHLRLRCRELEAERDETREQLDTAWRLREKACDERDEARKWALKFGREGIRARQRSAVYELRVVSESGERQAQINSLITDRDDAIKASLLFQRANMKLSSERDEAHAQLAGVRDTYDTTVNIAVRARAQRDSARNDALDEALTAARKVIQETRAVISDKTIINDRLTTVLLSLKTE